MTRHLFTLLTLACPLFSLAQNHHPEPAALQEGWMKQLYGSFTENRGQLRDTYGQGVPDVLFYARCQGGTLFITQEGISYILSKTETGADSSLRTQALRIDETLVGAHILRSNIDRADPVSSAVSNYFNPACPAGIYGVQQFNYIRIRNIYPGITWVLDARNGKMSYDFELDPGADPGQIQLLFQGGDGVRISAEGRLQVTSKIGTLQEESPVSRQGDKTIGTTFQLQKDGKIGFRLSKYNKQSPLLIDPSISWSTFFGGSGSDAFHAITIDAAGNIFVTGQSGSVSFPTVAGGGYFDGSLNTANDVVIVKFGPAGNLLWSTFYGGDAVALDDERGLAVKTDAAGNVFVCGNTNATNFPTLNGGGYYNATFNNGATGNSDDGFLLKFSNSGTRLFATYLGGSSSDLAHDLDLDASGNIFVAGETSSNDFPIHAGGGYNDNSVSGNDGFIMKFANNGSLLWSSYFGGANSDMAFTVSVDNTGNIYLGGATSSPSGFPIQNAGGAYNDASQNGSFDGFLARFNAGLALTWCTYVGGSADDYVVNTAIDGQNNLLVEGSTASSNFPTFHTGVYYFDNTLGNGSGGQPDVFIQKYSAADAQLWSTFYGGQNVENVFIPQTNMPFNDAIKADQCGNVYVSFTTLSSDITTHAGECNSYNDIGLSNYKDCFIVKFKKYGQLAWGSFIGGMSNPYTNYQALYNGVCGMSLAIDHKNNVLATGVSDNAFGFPFQQSANAYFDNTNMQAGDADAFLMRFQQPTLNAGVDYTHCTGGCTGTASVVDNSPCPGYYTYAWSTGATTQSVSNLCNGSYSVIVTDTLLGCSVDTVNFTLTSGIQISPVVSAFSCPFTCDGTASITLPGNPSGVTYQWTSSTGGTSSTSSISGLCPGGTNTLTVNVPGCGNATYTFSIPAPPVITIDLNSLLYMTNTPCPSICNGEATVSIQGGEFPGHIVWSNGDTGPVADSLCYGQVYTVTATDSACYTATINNITLPPILPPQAQVTVTPSCGCNGSAVAALVNGLPPFTFLWSNGATTPSVSGLCPGNYWVIITGSCGGDTTNFSVTGGTPLVLDSIHVYVPPCPHQCNGFGQVIYTGGVSPITWIWSNGTTGPNATNLCDDSTYYVQGFDACGDTVYDSVTVHANPNTNFNVNAAVTAYGCPGTGTGTAVAQANGGHPPYTYYWSNGQTGQTATGLNPGTSYTVWAIDACNDTTHNIIVFPNPPPINVTMSTTPSCAASCVGSVSCAVSGGIAPYSYTWSTGAVGTTFILNTCANTSYTVTVTDVCGTVHTGTAICPLAAPMAPVIAVDSASCSTGCSGSATVTFTGGTPPFVYYWSNGTYTQSAHNFCADSTYYVIVQDPGCATDTLYITFPGYPQLQVVGTNVTSVCPGYCTGSAAAAATGGNPPYSFHWSNGQNTQNASNLCAGNYYVVVTDQCGAHDTAHITVNTIPAVQASIINIVNNTCYSGCTGSATVSTTGGTPPFNYNWSNGQTTVTATNLCAGTYTVIVTDPGCSADTATVTITSPTIMVATLDTTGPAICKYDCNAFGSVSTSGGIPPFNYFWSNGATTSSTHTLCTGNNYVIITAPGCSADTIYFHINSLSNLIVNQVSVTATTCYDTCNGAASALASNGVGTYTYAWSGGQSGPSVSGLCGGNNIVIATDSLGCVAKDTINVPQPPQLQLDTLIVQSHCENPDGAITIAAIGGTAPYGYLWSNGSDSTTIYNLLPGTYSVWVTDSHGCIAQFPVTMTGAYPHLHISNDTTVILGNGLDLFVTGALHYTWTPPVYIDCDTCTQTHWYSLESASYCVVGTDAWGCMDTACVDITVDDNCGDVDMPNAFSPNGDGHNDIFHPLAWCIESIDYVVYNRWGQKLFEGHDLTHGWDGNFNGQPQEIGVYVWYLTATDLRGRYHEKKGNVTLVR